MTDHLSHLADAIFASMKRLRFFTHGPISWDDIRDAADTYTSSELDCQPLDILTDMIVARMVKHFEWQPIETAPKDGTNVLLVNYRGNIAAGLWQGTGKNEGWWLRGGNQPDAFFNSPHGPTQWMPLPPAPSKK